MTPPRLTRELAYQWVEAVDEPPVREVAEVFKDFDAAIRAHADGRLISVPAPPQELLERARGWQRWLQDHHRRELGPCLELADHIKDLLALVEGKE